MCGIVGFFNTEDVKSRIERGLKSMSHRGRDGKDLFCSKEGGLGHVLHSVVGGVGQPLGEKFVFNGEIYNWKELRKRYDVEGENDSEVVLRIIEKEGVEKVSEFEGVFSFCYWDKENNIVYLCRDIIGIKPLWYSDENGLCFASEKKVLKKEGYDNMVELNPRKILVYDLENDKINFREREFFSIYPQESDYEKIKEGLKDRLWKALKKRVPDCKVGVLFSGGVDSGFIVKALQEMGVDFTCYTAALEDENMKEADDLKYAERIAEKWGVKLKVNRVKLDEVSGYLERIVPLIEDSNVVKSGVALPFYLSCELAKKDGVKVMFSGLGSEEIFAGYERHSKSSDVNNECVNGLKMMYERDLYRDDVITMYHGMELRVPLLDNELVDFSLKIPSEYKIREGVKKYVFRDAVNELGVDEEIAFRRKKAAQYGSKFDKAIGKLAKKEKKSKSEYLKKFSDFDDLKLGALFSSGKDSTYAVYLMKRMNYDVSCLISVISENPDSYMFHTPNIDLVDLQAEAMGMELIKRRSEGVKEKELEDLEESIKEAKERFGIEGVVTGALFSTYQRERIVKVCEELGLKVFSPLWHKDQEEEMKELVNNRFEVVVSSIACDGLDESWVGKVIGEEEVDKLVELNKKLGVNIAGEGGEFESLVLDCPLFEKKIKIKKSSKVMENKFTGKLLIEDAGLVRKDGR